MISSVLAMLMLAPPPADTVARARKEYSACLSGFMKQSLKEKVEDGAFESGIGPACTAQETRFRSAVVAVDTAAGIKRAAAEENADLEISDMLANIKEAFKDYKSSNTSPGR